MSNYTCIAGIACMNGKPLTALETVIELNRLKRALDEIENPLKYIKAGAEKEGKVVNGTAWDLCNDAHYLRSIATKALR